MQVKEHKTDGGSDAFIMADGSMAIYKPNGESIFLTSRGVLIPERCRHQRATMESAVKKFNSPPPGSWTESKRIKGRHEFHPVIEWTAVIILGIIFGVMFASSI